MTYPNNPGFQAHSDTSRAAAQSMAHVKNDMAKRVHDAIKSNHTVGMTCDELAERMDIINGTVAARLRELELTGKIVKTKMRRDTRAGRKAVVYVDKALALGHGIEIDVRHTKPAPAKHDAPAAAVGMDAEYKAALEFIRDKLLWTGYGAEHKPIMDKLREVLGNE